MLFSIFTSGIWLPCFILAAFGFICFVLDCDQFVIFFVLWCIWVSQCILEKLSDPSNHNIQVPHLLAKLTEIQRRVELMKTAVVRQPLSKPGISPDTTSVDEMVAGDNTCNAAIVGSLPADAVACSLDPRNYPVCESKQRIDPGAGETELLRVQDFTNIRGSFALSSNIALNHHHQSNAPDDSMDSDSGSLHLRNSVIADRILHLSPRLSDLLELTRRPLVGDRVDLVEQVMDMIANAHLQTCLYTRDKVAAGRTKLCKLILEGVGIYLSKFTTDFTNGKYFYFVFFNAANGISSFGGSS